MAVSLEFTQFFYINFVDHFVVSQLSHCHSVGRETTASVPGWKILNGLFVLRFKYTTKFSLPKIACPAIVYAEIVVVIDPFFVGVCPWIKVFRYNPTEICQQRLQGVRNVAQKLCSWERSFTLALYNNKPYILCNDFSQLWCNIIAVACVFPDNTMNDFETCSWTQFSCRSLVGVTWLNKKYLCVCPSNCLT